LKATIPIFSSLGSRSSKTSYSGTKIEGNNNNGCSTARHGIAAKSEASSVVKQN
jgi:hypothetical protein